MNTITVGAWAWDWATRAFYSILTIWNVLMRATGTKGIFIIMFLFAVAYRLLAAPLMGAALSAGSDVYTASRAKRGSDSKEISKI